MAGRAMASLWARNGGGLTQLLSAVPSIGRGYTREFYPATLAVQYRSDSGTVETRRPAARIDPSRIDPIVSPLGSAVNSLHVQLRATLMRLMTLFYHTAPYRGE